MGAIGADRILIHLIVECNNYLLASFAFRLTRSVSGFVCQADYILRMTGSRGPNKNIIFNNLRRENFNKKATEGEFYPSESAVVANGLR